jgi:5-methylthioadenosine/S-adenosylhomocysteine deaminase
MPFTLGIVGGSGLLKSKLEVFKTLHEEYVDTIHGRVFLRSGKLSADVNLVFVQRHDAQASRVYTQPAEVNYAAIALALKAKGCDGVIGTCSVGSLKASLPVSAIVVPDDFYCPADLRRVYADYRAHFMPAIDERLREGLLAVLREAGQHPIPAGTYVNSRGPRFETKAEIRQMAVAGDLVGMTAAHECSACCEVGLPYAMLCLVDNFANGVGPALSLELFHAAQAANLGILETSLRAVLERLPARLAAAAAAVAAPAEAATPSETAAGAGAGAAAAPIAHVSAPSAASSSDSTPLPTPVATSPTPDRPLHVDLLVHARYVVPLAPGREQQVLDYHSMAVLDGKIIDVLPTHAATGRYAAAKTVTLSASHALMPGLVNAHTHLAMNLMRGVADDMPLAQWLTEQIWPTEGRLVSPDFCRAGAEAAIAELIRSGVTCINEMYWFPAATAEVVERVGLRGTVGGVILEFPSSYASNAGEYIEKGAEVLTRFVPGGHAIAAKAGLAAAGAGDASGAGGGAGAAPAPSGRVSFALAPHAPYTVSDPTFERIRDLAAAMDVKVHLHLHETAGEVEQSKTGTAGAGKHMSAELTSPVDNLKRMGLLNERLIAVHMTQLTDDEIASVAASKASVVHCPNSNLKLASGFCPVSKLLRAGVNVALGTDSASSNNSLDFFQELKLAAVLAKGVSGDATAVPAWLALRMATLNGAIALGIDKVAGSLEVGKAADFIAVDLGRLEQQPLFNVLSHLVYACNRSCVTDVWVAGSQLLDARRLTTIDEGAVLKAVGEWAEKVRPGATAEDKHTHLADKDAKHVHTEEHGAGEAGKVHTKGEH